MAFQYPVPAQRSASAYLDMVARLWEGPIILVGHSKEAIWRFTRP